jgi:3-isopropylmalate dehydrogenase
LGGAQNCCTGGDGIGSEVTAEAVDSLTHKASMRSGSMGMLPSASPAEGNLGLYEPIRGSALDNAGKGIANSIAATLSAELLLQHSLKLEREALAEEAAVEQVLPEGYRMGDIARPGGETVSTTVMGDLIARRIKPAL